MNTGEYYASRERMIRERWFPNHAATLHLHEGKITWRRPDSTNYWMRYMIDGRALIVYGDAGDAIYGWSQSLTWEFLAGLNLDYFAGKCIASETGSLFKMWDMRVAQEEFDRLARERLLDKSLLSINPPKLFSQGEWNMWLARHGSEIFGDCYELGSIGEVIHVRCQGHLIGLKMIAEQAKAKLDKYATPS